MVYVTCTRSPDTYQVYIIPYLYLCPMVTLLLVHVSTLLNLGDLVAGC